MNYQKSLFLIADNLRAIRVSYEKTYKQSGPKYTTSNITGSISSQAAFLQAMNEAQRSEEIDTNFSLVKTFDPDVKKGDFVVVPTNTRHGMTVCKVVDVDVDPELDAGGEIPFIVGVVNTDEFKKLCEQEAQAVERIRRADEKVKRKKLRDALLADAADEIKELPLYNVKNGS